MKQAAIIVLVSFSAASLGMGCSAIPLGGCLYTNVTTRGSYGKLISETEYKRFTGDKPVDYVPVAKVSGKACGSAVLGLIATGDNSYEQAIKNALTGVNAEELIDVRVDYERTLVLGYLYAKQCTIVSGLAINRIRAGGFRPAAQPPQSAAPAPQPPATSPQAVAPPPPKPVPPPPKIIAPPPKKGQ